MINSDRPEIKVDAQTAGRAVESLVSHGDISDLTPEERTRYYVQFCESLGLSPATLPFAILRLNGKEIYYPTRGATDQLAAIHRINREIIEGPKVIDVGGVKVVYAVCRATHPNGRMETSTGMVPLKIGAEDICNSFLKAECVPLDSEILTRRGFKRYDEIQIGEEVLAYNVDAGRSEWVPLENVSVYESAKVFKLSTEKGLFSIRCTEDHSWVIGSQPYKPCPGSVTQRGPYKNRGPERKLVKANEIRKGQRLIVAAPAVGGDHPLSEIDAEILGWIMTDGTIKRTGNYVSLMVYPSKPQRVSEIRALFARSGLLVRESIGQPTVRTSPGGNTSECLPQHCFRLNVDESKAMLARAGIEGPSDMPRLVTRLSAPSRSVMFRAMMAADADAKGRFGKKRKPGVMEAWAILATLEGIALGKPGMSSTGEVPTQQALDSAYVRGSNLSLSLDREESVWCPTTQYGTWVMRQNGRITITGNTKAKRRVTLSLLGLGMIDESEVESLPSVQALPSPIDGRRSPLPAPKVPSCKAHETLREKLSEVETLEQGEQVFEDYRQDIVDQTGADQTTALIAAMHDVIAHLENKDIVCRTELKRRWRAHESARAAAVRAKLAAQTPSPAPVDAPAIPEPEMLRIFMANVDTIELPVEAAYVWIKHRTALVATQSDVRRHAWTDLCQRVLTVGKHASLGDAAAWLKSAIAEQDAIEAKRQQHEAPAAGEDDAERTAIASEDTIAAAMAAAVEEWRAHVNTKKNEVELARSFLKHEKKFKEQGIADECLAIAADRLMPMLGHDSQSAAISFIRNQGKKAS